MIHSNKRSFWFALPLVLLMASCEQQETTMPVKKNIEDAVFASGYIEQEDIYTVSAKVEGILLSSPVKEGDEVKKHDLIALIESDVQDDQLKDAMTVYRDAVKNASADSPQLQNLQTQIEQAQQQLAFDEENFIRYKGLWEKNSVSKLDYEKVKLQYTSSQNNLVSLEKQFQDIKNDLDLSVERTGVQLNTQRSLLKDYKLSSGATGTVINVFKKQGELVRRGEAVARIGSGEYLIKLFVSEEDITKVNIGQKVAVNINTYPGEAFQATVSKIYPGFDEVEQSYIVEAKFAEMPERMFSGTQLQANIETNSRKDVVVIPTAYITKGNIVLLENGEEKQIVTGSKNSDWTEVVSGIGEADLIVKP